MVSNVSMRMKRITLATLFAALSLVLISVIATSSRSARGLPVRIASLGRCGEARNVVLEVLPDRGLRVDNQIQKREHLGPLLDDIFKTRVYRYAFVFGDPRVTFGDVAEVIDLAANHVDYVTILTPSVMKAARWDAGTCIDPNLPQDYIAHPPR